MKIPENHGNHENNEKHENPENKSRIHARRNFLKVGGVALMSTSILGFDLFPGKGSLFSAWASEGGSKGLLDKNSQNENLDENMPLVQVKKGLKPVYLPLPQSKDLVAHSLAENLFINDIMMEHATFFTLLMSGPDLVQQRTLAERYKMAFTRQLDRIKRASWNQSTYQSMNNSTLELLKSFSDYKRRMEDLQSSGKMHSLVWPTFFDHTAHEAERFTNRIAMLSKGNVEIDRSEMVEFWTHIMQEHSAFIAHLLDPVEVQLINKANNTTNAFNALHSTTPSLSDLMQLGEEVVDFKLAAEKGILAGTIKSIIHPALADHVLREGVKFTDELKRI